MLNLMAALHPNLLRAPQFVIDKSQSIGRTANRTDGNIPTFTTSSSIFSFVDGDTLSPNECLKLMGHDITRMKVDGISASQVRAHLGMSVHVSVAGLIIAGLLASVGSG